MSSPQPTRWWPALVVVVLAALRWGQIWFFRDSDRQFKVRGTFQMLGVAVVLLLVWLLFFSRLRVRTRLLVLGVLLAAVGASALLVRVRGFTGDLIPILEWRWASPKVAPSRHLAPVEGSAQVVRGGADFAQILGPQRNGVLAEPALAPVWDQQSPQLLWRQPIGAGWAGFAVQGRRAVTLEQAAECEEIVCYDLLTGARRWAHGYPARFEESSAGIGPRTVPTISGERVYATGATGILTCLDLAAADPKGWRGSILRLSPDGQQVERFATGLRFSYGMAFNPEGDLFFTDNHGGDNPTEELNVGVRDRFYGQNPSKFPGHPPAQSPLVSVQYGVAPTALAFNAPTNEFGATGGDLFMACWGPDWLFNRGSIVRVRLLRQPGGAYRAQEFPFAHEVPKVTALVFAANGDLYATLFGREAPGHQPSPMADGAIYRFLPAAWVEPGAAVQSKFPFVKGNVSSGKKLFEERGCAACHSLGGRDDMLGPDLGGLGEIYSANEVLNLIRKPSESIKSGHETQEVKTTDGEVFLGRMQGSNAGEIILVTVGNRLVRVPRSKIASEQTRPTSLMPEGLLDGLSEQQTNDLLAYLGVRDREPAWLMRQWLKVEGVLRSFAPQVSLKAKLAAIAAVGVALVAALRFWRKRRRAR